MDCISAICISIYSSIFMILNYSVKKSIINRKHQYSMSDLESLLIEIRLNNIFIRNSIIKDE